MDIRFLGQVKKGDVVLDDPTGFKRHILSLDGKKIQVIVRKYKTTRSNEQNKYYWGAVVRVLGDELGYMPEEIHEALKFKFLRKEGKLETVRSTTSLTTTEFEMFLEKVRIWALTDFQITIPLPNEVEIDL